MNYAGLLAVVDQLAGDAFGYDWFDLRGRLRVWMRENPGKARELVHYAHELLEVWDHD